MNSSNRKISAQPILWLVFIFALLFLGSYIRLSFFLVSIKHLPVITDEALNMLMARAIASGHFPLLFWTQPYQFPLEAYLLSLVQHLTPHNAFGARLFLALVASSSLFGFSLVAALNPKSRLRAIWPALALIAIPSSYSIVRLVGMTIPQYTSSVTFAWLLPLLFVLSSRERSSSLIGVMLGVCAGLAISTHLLTLSIVLPVSLAFCLGSSLKQARKHCLLFFPGALLGLIPYLIAVSTKGGYEKVSAVISAGDAMNRLWDPILKKILTVAMGINPSIFPDFDFREEPFAWLILPFVFCFLTLLLLALGSRSVRLIRRLAQRQWPVLEVKDIFVAGTLLVLILASFAGFGIKYRYLLPAAWYFPFLVWTVYDDYKLKVVRVPLALFTIGMLVVNFTTITELKSIWSQTHFSYGIPRLPPLSPLVKHLDDRGISECYAPWWLVYRINYGTGERINCAQPFNERFPGWPLPDAKRDVDSAANTPFIITRRAQGGFLSRKFEHELRSHNIAFDKATVNHYFVYTNLQHALAPKVQVIAPARYALHTNSGTQQQKHLIDGAVKTTWSAAMQSRHARIEVLFHEPTSVNMIKLYDTARRYKKDTNPVRISYFDGNTWTPLIKKSHGLRYRTKIGFTPALAAHRGSVLTFLFQPVVAEKLRVELAYKKRITPLPLKKPWRLAELELFE